MTHDESQARTRTPDDVQKEISETRAELDETLDEIGRRLSPHELKERVLEYAEETVHDVTETVQQHKMPILMVGGLAVAAFLIRNRVQARETEARAEHVREIWDRMASALADSNGHAALQLKLGDVAGTISDVASAARDSVANLAEEIMPSVTRTAKDAMASIEESPALPWLAVGLGIGALMLYSRGHN